MNRKFFLASISFFIFFLACAVWAGSEGKAPAFTLKDASGKVYSLAQYKDKNAVLMTFWASWCQPCVLEMPMIEKTYQKFRKDGLEVLSINVDTASGVAKAQQIVQRKAVTFPVLYDADSKAAGLYNPKGWYPFTLLVDKAGDIVYTHQGFNPGDEKELETEIGKALGLPKP